MNAHRRSLTCVALILPWWTTHAGTARAQASVPSGPGVVAPPPDLLAIRTIAVNAMQFARSGDLGRARAQVEALEVQWRQEKSKMPSQRRQAIDTAIDRVERELRFWRARRTDSAAALQTLVDVIDQTR